ncbi:MAG: M20/M25/M40 family metallo-hydrolase [Chloroflexi bacterium]|nr:MAG: M20/M25/M40 family metallo-hydrolase [Chloroflexota bacterium]
MKRVKLLAHEEIVQAALQELQGNIAAILDSIVAIQQIPAPTFAEAERASYMRAQFEALGLQDVEEDSLHNVYGRFPAASSAERPPVVVSAHLDTVFPAGTALPARRNGRFLYGPGIGDNATGLAGLLALARTLTTYHFSLPADVWLVANVGEEGLGDLCGMRAVVKRFGQQARYIIVEGGLYGQISHQAIGVRRFRIEIEAPGGHSWGNFGNASAVHELGKIIAQITSLSVPQNPKTTYNVGVIEGGTSINTIAQTASMLLDLRSEAPEALAELETAVREIVAQANETAKHKHTGVRVTMEQIGNRPAGSIPRQSPLVKMAVAALHQVGCSRVSYIASSTDANIPLSQGIPAVCIGLAESGNAHRLDEYLDVTHLPNGLAQLLLLTLAAARYATS